jgi:hypothetical protein
MSGPRRDETRLAAGLGVKRENAGSANHSTSGRRPNQGISPARNPDQQAPRWDDPPGLDAVRLLEQLWGRR